MPPIMPICCCGIMPPICICCCGMPPIPIPPPPICICCCGLLPMFMPPMFMPPIGCCGIMEGIPGIPPAIPKLGCCVLFIAASISAGRPPPPPPLDDCACCGGALVVATGAAAGVDMPNGSPPCAAKGSDGVGAFAAADGTFPSKAPQTPPPPPALSIAGAGTTAGALSNAPNRLAAASLGAGVAWEGDVVAAGGARLILPRPAAIFGSTFVSERNRGALEADAPPALNVAANGLAVASVVSPLAPANLGSNELLSCTLSLAMRSCVALNASAPPPPPPLPPSP